MAEDLREKVEGYKIQLEQVEAMLSTDPDNDELKKLKEDLVEVIQLSSHLLGDSKQTVSADGASAESSTMRSDRPNGVTGSTQLPTASGVGQKRKNREEEKKQREYKLAKKAKKQARQQEIEQAHEADKKRWQDFNSKILKHNKTHLTKTSIFATTDNLGGRVGVGTCGTSGKSITPSSTFQPQRPTGRPATGVNGAMVPTMKPFGMDRFGL